VANRNFLISICSKLGALCAIFIFFGANPARAESMPLKPGRFSCFTISVTARTQTAADVLEESNRKRAGNPVRPMQAPQIFLAPAAFGNIILDGKGGYTMPTTRQSGRYGFNTATGRPTFTGDLGAMKLVEYRGTGENFTIGWQGMNFQCSLPAAPSSTIAAGSRPPNSAFVAYAGPVRATATARDFRGHYEGSYVCGSAPSFMQLDLDAKPDGTITGLMQFGGMRTDEITYSVGSYTLKGTWRGTHYVLKADQWVKQPNGYVMIDLEGDLTTLGTSGRILYSSCDSFALRRAG
jgi:hypothetical protein